MINKRRFVFDTNVVVSAFLFGQSKPRQALEDVLKVLDETDNLQKPNPPAPFPTREGGFQSLSPLRGEVWRGVYLYIKNFSNTLLDKAQDIGIILLSAAVFSELQERSSIKTKIRPLYYLRKTEGINR